MGKRRVCLMERVIIKEEVRRHTKPPRQPMISNIWLRPWMESERHWMGDTHKVCTKRKRKKKIIWKRRGADKEERIKSKQWAMDSPGVRCLHRLHGMYTFRFFSTASLRGGSPTVSGRLRGFQPEQKKNFHIPFDLVPFASYFFMLSICFTLLLSLHLFCCCKSFLFGLANAFASETDSNFDFIVYAVLGPRFLHRIDIIA